MFVAAAGECKSKWEALEGTQAQQRATERAQTTGEPRVGKASTKNRAGLSALHGLSCDAARRQAYCKVIT